MSARFTTLLISLCVDLWAAGISGGVALGATTQDSVPDSLAATGGAHRWIEVTLDSKQVLLARRVQPLANGLLRVYGADGAPSAVSAGRVRSIRSGLGLDVTYEVLEKGRSVSVDDPERLARPEQPGGHVWQKLGFVALVLSGLVLIAVLSGPAGF